jgi:hypothetical protein
MHSDDRYADNVGEEADLAGVHVLADGRGVLIQDPSNPSEMYFVPRNAHLPSSEAAVFPDEYLIPAFEWLSFFDDRDVPSEVTEELYEEYIAQPVDSEPFHLIPYCTPYDDEYCTISTLEEHSASVILETKADKSVGPTPDVTVSADAAAVIEVEDDLASAIGAAPFDQVFPGVSVTRDIGEQWHACTVARVVAPFLFFLLLVFFVRSSGIVMPQLCVVCQYQPVLLVATLA